MHILVYEDLPNNSLKIKVFFSEISGSYLYLVIPMSLLFLAVVGAANFRNIMHLGPDYKWEILQVGLPEGNFYQAVQETRRERYAYEDEERHAAIPLWSQSSSRLIDATLKQFVHVEANTVSLEEVVDVGADRG